MLYLNAWVSLQTSSKKNILALGSSPLLSAHPQVRGRQAPVTPGGFVLTCFNENIDWLRLVFAEQTAWSAISQTYARVER